MIVSHSIETIARRKRPKSGSPACFVFVQSSAKALPALGQPQGRTKISVLTACFAAICVTFFCSPLAAQEWPTRQVMIISPFQAGSSPDSVARILADQMQQRLGKPIITAGGIKVE